MLGKPIKYTTFEDEPQTVTEVFWFNISQPELLKYVSDPTNSLQKKIRDLSDAKTLREIILLIEDFIMISYGVRSDDGKRFDKSDELRKEFICHAAYPVLYMELASDENKTVEFIKGIMPPELGDDLVKAFRKADEIVEAERAKLADATPTEAP